MKNLKKKISLILIFCLIFTQMPVIAFAAVDSNTHQQPSESNVVLKESTETVTTFNLGNGYMHKAYHGEAVRFEDEDGKLTDYNPALISVSDDRSENGKDLSDYRWTNKEGDSKQYFPDELDSSSPILMEKDGYGIEMSFLSETAFETPQLQKEKIETPYYGETERNVTASYASAGGEQKIEYTSEKHGIKESIVLEEKPEDNVFSYALKLKNLTAELEENRVMLKDSDDKKVKAVIDAPFMFDASEDGAYSTDIIYTLTNDTAEKNSWILTMTVSEDYLEASERVYPVTVDPTVYWEGYDIIDAVYVDANDPATGTEYSYFYYAGDDFKTFLSFPDVVESVSGTSVTEATLYLTEGPDSEGGEVNVKRVTSSWPYNISWNNQPSADTTPLDSFTADGYEGNFYAADLTELFQGYANGSTEDYGIVLEGSDYTVLYGTSGRNNAYPAYFSITYQSSIPSAPSSLSVRKHSGSGYTSSSYFKQGEPVYVSWSGIESTMPGKVQYKITAADSSTPPTTSVGSESIDLSQYRDFAVPEGSASGTNILAAGSQNLPEGKYTIHIRGVNSAGQAGETKTATIYVDGTEPLITDVTVNSGMSADNPSTDNRPTISWNAEDAYFSSVKVAINNGTAVKATTSSGSKTYRIPSGKLTTSGIYLFTVTAEDKAGNKTESRISYYLDVDNPAIESLYITPETTVMSPSGNVMPQVSWNVSDAFFDHIEYKIGNEDYQDMSAQASGSFIIPESAWGGGSGTYTLTFKAQDKAGHTATVERTYYLTEEENHVPQNISAREYYGKAFLTWQMNTYIPSVKQYDLHRGNSAGFVPSADTLIAEDVEMEKMYLADTDVLDAGTYFYRFVIKDRNNAEDDILTDAVSFTASDISSAFSNRNGFKGYLGYFEFGMPQGTGYIEKSSGNLLYEQTDYTVSNAQLDYSLTRTYNSENTVTGMFGKGWSDSYHKELYTDGNKVYFVDSDGSVLTYESEGDAYNCEESKAYTLTKTDGNFTLTDKELTEYTFNKSGQMVKTEEPNGCSLTYVYDVQGRLTGVTSKEGDQVKIMNFTYQGEAGSVSSITDFAGTNYSYTYSNSNLTNLTISKGSESVSYDYGYNGNGLLNSISDGEANSYVISHAEGTVSVTYPNQDYFELVYGGGSAVVKKYHKALTDWRDKPIYEVEMTYDVQTGRILSETDAAGKETSYTYQTAAEGNPYLVKEMSEQQYYQEINADNTISMDKTDSLVTTYDYDDRDNLTAEDRSTGEASIYQYNADNLLGRELHGIALTEDGDAKLTEICEYDYEVETTNVEQITESIYEPVENLEDVAKNRVEPDAESQSVTAMTYDDAGRETSATETENGSKISEFKSNYGIDSVTTTATTGEVSQTAVEVYDAMGRVISQTEDGIVTTHAYDFLGRVTETVTTYPDGRVLSKTMSYTPNGSLETEVSERGVRTDYEYDSLNRLICSETSGTGIETSIKTTEYSYMENLQIPVSLSGGSRTIPVAYVETEKDGSNNVLSVRYMDGRGNVVKEQSGTAWSSFDYDKSGQQVLVHDGNSSLTELTLYDNEGREKAQIIRPALNNGTYAVSSGSITAFTEYDEYRNVSAETDAKGITTVYVYDEQGRMTECYQKKGSQTAEGILVSYTDISDASEFALTTITDANGNVKKEYTNAAGQTVEIRDENASGSLAIVKEYSYDEKGRMVMENTGGFGFTGYIYNDSDQLTRKYVMDDAGGMESDIIYTYNNYGEMTSAVKDGETGSRGDRETVSSQTWEYDVLGNVISESASYGEDDAGLLAEHSYDSRGNLVKTSYSDETGLGDITYEYDSHGNLQKIKKNGQTAAEYTYDSGYRQLTETVYAEPGSSSYTLKTSGYDTFGRTASIVYTKNGTSNQLESYVYEYDKAGNITERSRVNTQGSINETREYTYSDFYDRLMQTAVTKNGSTKTTSYGYDPVGNRISMTENGSTTTYEYNGLNQLTEKEDATGITTYTYDSRGNQISESSPSGEMEFEYFITGELKKVKKNNTTIQENKYDHEGIRVSREENSTVRDYYYVNGRPVYTTDDDEKSSANLVSPYGEILNTYRGTSGQNAYTYLTDIQGSTGSLMDESGTVEAVYTYSDFGEVTENITPDIDNEICYTGAVYDDTTGLHYMNARYYDPENGRFISQDTYRGELNNPGQWHLYVYCANNPINYVDPSGHDRKYSYYRVCLFRSYGVDKVEVYLYFKSTWRFVNSVKYYRISIMEATGWWPETYWEKKNRVKDFTAFKKGYIRLGSFKLSEKVKYAFVNTYNVRFYDMYQTKWVRFTNIIAEQEIDKKPKNL